MTGEGAGSTVWQRTADLVLRGLNHELSNRLMVLGSLVSAAPQTAEGEQLSKQVAGLVRLLGLYRSLPLMPGTRPEAIRVQDVVPTAVLLFGAQLATSDVPCEVLMETSAPPVIVDSTILLQALVLLLSVAAQQLDQRSRSAGLLMRVHGEPEWVHVTVGARVATGGSLVQVDELEALQLLTAGEVSLSHNIDGVACVHLTLPSVIRVRRESGSVPATRGAVVVTQRS